MNAITVKNLKKVYRTHKRGKGMWNAVVSLFNRKYENKHALKGVSFEVEEGEVLGLIGPNGAGKSTTIKALSGILHPTSGDVKVIGYVPWKDRVKYVKHLGVVLGQKEQLWWDLPAIDTFYMNREVYQIPNNKFKRRLNYMVKLLDVKEVINSPVRDLSLGERMKCKLIAALLHSPKVVFLDEPTIGLDIIARDRLRDFVKEVNQKEGTTFIVTTHDMQDIEKLCKRIVIINHGVIVYDGLLEKLKSTILNNKIIDVKFETKVKGFRLKGCKLLEKGDYNFVIEADTKVTKIKKVIDYLLLNYEVADINITDPPIEEIIQRIYKEKKKWVHT
ncbi:ATP-binding cassette domain-containing protein [archaeon]|jgi:ABC-2 type transport system ATP-binding protein|nr:ATP-binding cassette domain-containing protein [archaeon]MBT4416921.1 ATP-binding cassette domain-containing protein [archaeon]